MQPYRGRGPRTWKGRPLRRSRASYVRLGLLLIFSAILIVFGHHRSRWNAPHVGDPFPPSVTGRADPFDGDSLWVGDEEVRLKGIDAPEWKQECGRAGVSWKCGVAARDELARAIGGNEVTCRISERDVYGRLLGNCVANGRDLNAHMVSTGMAVAYGAFDSEQQAARSSKAGIWAGDFENPRDWRAGNVADEAR
ncbi:MAG: thermonuclease family protein [Hyphomicrobium sp.]|nr:MAG: thermonuclease family protein [Hyphomicrobium sp.]